MHDHRNQPEFLHGREKGEIMTLQTFTERECRIFNAGVCHARDIAQRTKKQHIATAIQRHITDNDLLIDKVFLSKAAGRDVDSPKVRTVLFLAAFVFIFSAFVFWPLVFRAMEIEGKANAEWARTD